MEGVKKRRRKDQHNSRRRKRKKFWVRFLLYFIYFSSIFLALYFLFNNLYGISSMKNQMLRYGRQPQLIK